MEGKKVLYISYDGMTEALGQSQVLPYLTGLRKLGYSFRLISFEKEETFTANRETIQDICNQSGISWHPQIYTKKPPIVSTLKDIRTMFQVAFSLQKTENFDIVHCRSYIPGIVGLSLKQKSKVKFLFDMRGFWADERIEGGIWNKKNPLFASIYRYFKRQEKELFRHADAIVSLTHRGEKEIYKLFPSLEKDEKITVIPCCVKSDLFDPTKITSEDKARLKEELNIPEFAFVLGYVGSIGTWYMLDEMMDFFKVHLTKFPDSIFLFVTGENPDVIFASADKRDISPACLRIIKTKHNEVPSYISIFDWSIFFIRPTFSKTASSPIKQGEIMSMGIPIVTNTGVGDTDEIIEKNKAGIVLKEFTEDEYKKVVFTKYPIDSEQIMRVAKEVFDLQTGIEKYSQIYQRLWTK